MMLAQLRALPAGSVASSREAIVEPDAGYPGVMSTREPVRRVGCQLALS
jgi:hypothetical protein